MVNRKGETHGCTSSVPYVKFQNLARWEVKNFMVMAWLGSLTAQALEVTFIETPRIF